MGKKPTVIDGLEMWSSSESSLWGSWTFVWKRLGGGMRFLEEAWPEHLQRESD